MKTTAPPAPTEQHFETELEINDFPQHARWKVTHKDSMNQISEWTGAAITTRGQYYPPNKVCEKTRAVFFSHMTMIKMVWLALMWFLNKAYTTILTGLLPTRLASI